MSEPLSEDKQITLINVYFAFILTTGLAYFVEKFLLKYPDILNKFFNFITDTKSLTGLVLTPVNTVHSSLTSINIIYSIDIAYFVIVYIWVIFHWIMYQKLMAMHPYLGPTSFFVDILFLSIVFFVLAISFSVYPVPISGSSDLSNFFLFITSFLILHVIGFITYIFFGKIEKERKWFTEKSTKNPFKKLLNYLKRILNFTINRPNLSLHFIWTIIFAIIVISMRGYSNIYFFYIMVISLVLLYAIIKFFIVKSKDELISIERSPVKNSAFKFCNNEYSKHYNEKFYKNNCYWYHIRIQNNHKLKPAINCITYLEGCKQFQQNNENKGQFIDLPDTEYRRFVEFKWNGVNTSEIIIEPTKYREFDGLCVYIDGNTTYLYFGINQNVVDNIKVKESYRIKDEGHYVMQFVMYSLNLKPERKIFVLHYNNNTALDPQEGNSEEKYIVGIDFHSNTSECIRCPNEFKKAMAKWKSINQLTIAGKK